MSKELKTCNYCGGDGYYTDDDNKPCNPNKSPEVSVPSVEDIADIIRGLDPKGAPRKLSKAIHAMLLRKLTEKV